MDKQELMVQIGENVRANRIRAGLTQAQLAEAADVGTPFIANIECGQKMMSVPTLIAVADALKVSCDSLVRPIEQADGTGNILLLLNDFSPQYLAKIERMIRTLLEEFPYPDVDMDNKCDIMSKNNL